MKGVNVVPPAPEHELWKTLLKGFWDAHKLKDKDAKNQYKIDVVEYYFFLLNERTESFKNLLREELEEAARAYIRRGKKVVFARAKATYRVRPGTGNYLPPLEWGLTIHPIFKVPYIPASSIKGALRAALAYFIVEKLDIVFCNEKETSQRCVDKEKEVLTLIEKITATLFGGAEKIGWTDDLVAASPIIVVDSYPTAPGKYGNYVVGDILNPHYPTTKDLMDELDVKPIPIVGVSINEGTEFTFIIAIDSERIREKVKIVKELLIKLKDIINKDMDIVEKFFNEKLKDRPEVAVGTLLLKALTEVGIGGKTTRGYGRFKVIELKVLH